MKQIPFLVTLLIAGAVGAQAQVRIGVKAGASAAITEATSYFEMQGLPSYHTGIGALMRLAPHAGLIADVQVTRHFFVQPGLLYAGKGYTRERNFYGNVPRHSPREHAYDVKEVTRLHTLELPVNLLYKTRIGKGKLFAGAGPFVALALAGDRDITNDRVRAGRDIRFGEEGEPRRFEAGVNITAGYELGKHWLAGVNYSRALTDAMPGINWYRSTWFGLSVGYLIGR